MSRIDVLLAELCPEGVKFATIGEVAAVGAGATPSKSVARYWTNGTIPWLNSGEVNKGTIFAADTFITQEGYDSCSTKMVPPGTVVMALAGQGKTRGMVARTRLECCTNQSLASIIPKENVDSDFLYHILKTQYVRLREVSSGDGTRGGLNLAMIRAYRIPVPPLEVQREIVRILDQFTRSETNLEAELKAELAARKHQFRHYRDSLITNLHPVEAPWLPMGDVGEFIRGRRFVKSDFTHTGVPCIHYGDIYTSYGTVATSTVHHLPEELAAPLRFAEPKDVILAAVGETVEDVGKAVAWLGETDVAIHDDCFLYRHSLSPKFVSYYLQTAAFHSQKEKYVSRAKVKRLSKQGLSKITLPVPSIEEQDRIVRILEEFEALTSALNIDISAELEARRKQYEYYRDRLLTFEEAVA